MERTLVIIKPDGVQRALTGEVISRFEKSGLKIVAAKMVWIDKDFSKRHYAEHVAKDFYPEVEEYVTEGPVLALVLEGQGSVAVVRKMVGSTKPEEANPGTIRGDLAHAMVGGRNIIHASANPEDAKKEINLWFTTKEIHTYQRADERHVQGLPN